VLLENQYMHNKSIMVGLLGKPNAGKSSLVNCLMGFDLTAVTNKPQTTRNRVNCIFTIDHTEIILVDTPGVHKSNKEMNKRMIEQTRDGVDNVDLTLLLVDSSFDPVQDIADLLDMSLIDLERTWLVLTKSDLPGKEVPEAISQQFGRVFRLSAKNEDGVNQLTGSILDQAAPGPHLYPGGEVSNKNERFFVSEYIREEAFNVLEQEIPYEVAVLIDSFQDFRGKSGVTGPVAAHIDATILVHRPSQRGIVVGAGGKVIKEIGTRARKKVEAMVGGKVGLKLHVKVSPKWFSNNYVLEQVGLPRAQNSNRVWRKR
jgi:GTP-binding protein Era